MAAPVYPPASGVGLDPPPGMTPAKGFTGFQGNKASIVITEMPKIAYAQIASQRDLFVTHLQADKAQDVDINGVQGFLIRGQQQAAAGKMRKWVLVLNAPDETALVSAEAPLDDEAIGDAAMATALHSIVMRPRPGLEQQVAALPFKVGDLAGFRVANTDVGAAMMLVGGAKDSGSDHAGAHIVVAFDHTAAPKDGRLDFAKAQLRSFQGVRTTDITSAKLFDSDGAQWAEVDAKGSEGPQQAPVAISYFLRFDPSDTISVVCVAPAGAGSSDVSRFKDVALSTRPNA